MICRYQFSPVHHMQAGDCPVCDGPSFDPQKVLENGRNRLNGQQQRSFNQSAAIETGGDQNGHQTVV